MIAGKNAMSANVPHVPPGLMRGPSPAPAGIRDVVYLADRRELHVTFTSGRRYAYCDVPRGMYEAYLASPVKGAFFNIAIRGRFQFHEVTPQRATQH